jgi:hypothetical protein
MTTIKTKNSKPATSKKGMRGLIPGKGSTPASSRRPAASGSSGLLGRAQATLPHAKRNVKKSGAQKVVAALGKATSSTTAHRPSTKSMLGILVGGVGAAAVATRRHNPEPDELLPEVSSVPADEASDGDSSQFITTVADPNIDTGGEHGDPQGPDPSAAA